eukprot:EG_transcript_17651
MSSYNEKVDKLKAAAKRHKGRPTQVVVANDMASSFQGTASFMRSKSAPPARVAGLPVADPDGSVRAVTPTGMTSDLPMQPTDPLVPSITPASPMALPQAPSAPPSVTQMPASLGPASFRSLAEPERLDKRPGSALTDVEEIEV